MGRLQALDARLDQLPWYVDAAICSLPGLLVVIVGGLLWDWSLVAALPILLAVFLGRFLHHRRLGSSGTREHPTSRT